jgi:ADP-ribosylglycohydrolase
MTYPDPSELNCLAHAIELQLQLRAEYGSRGIAPILVRLRRELKLARARLERLPADPALARKEPSALAAIRALRPRGPRRLWKAFDAKAYEPRLAGAFLGRVSGCTLGAPVELWPPAKMEALARENGERFPPVNYWTYVPEPKNLRYRFSRVEEYLRSGIRGVPVDDDVIYTLLGLLVLEEHGTGFATADVGQVWQKYLPMACTAEEVALKNLKRGIPASRAGAVNNPFCEWIGADIRSDPWGYAAPGWPERAAEMAWRDAFLSHRRQGIYGEMFFSAAIAAAFAVDDAVEALRIGLTEIPRDCALAHAVRWALRVAPRIRNHRQARAAVDRKFAGMHCVHTINNACLTIFGLTIGRGDFNRVIGETVAMGLDTDCTAATAGSIFGAVHGKQAIPSRWYQPFGDTVHSYLIKRKKFRISNLFRRFECQARRVHG